jgi:biotin carboxylase
VLRDPATTAAVSSGGNGAPVLWRRRSPRAAAAGTPAVLLLGNYRPTICLVRTLRSLGHRTVVGIGGEGGAEYSRFTDEVWDHPPLADGPQVFLSALARFLGQRPDIEVVLPVAEEFVRLLAAESDTLPADRVWAMPPAAVVGAMLDKTRAYQLAADAGVPVAPWAVIETYADLRRRCDAIGYPLVVRPLHSTRRLAGRKALIADDAAALLRAMPAWPPGQRALLAQRQVTGKRHNVYFAARDGRLVRLLEAVIERTDRTDDTGLAVAGRTVRPSADLVAFTEAMLSRLAYTGVGCAQFLVDRAGGAVHFLEINPRIAGNHAVAEAAGLELGRLSIELARPEPPDVPFVAGRRGLVYAWTSGDVRALNAAVRSGGIGPGTVLRWAAQIAATAVRADVHMTWRWDDPAPTLALLGRRLPGLRRLVAAPAAPERATLP